MRKSNQIILSAIFISAILACNNEKDEWINGNEVGKRKKDTTFRNQPYRYYHGSWYPIYNGMINPGRYNGASLGQISSSSYHPSADIRTGGFGSSSHFSAGS